MVITCAACGAEHPVGARFCSACGASLLRSCPVCAAEQPVSAAFCSACGSALGDPRRVLADSRQERRIVSALFADLAGSTALGERLDPEEVRALQGDFFHAVNGCVERFGGVTEKFAGDAILAVFGIPTVHEDDPERAVRAALAMRDELGPGPFGAAGVRIGVNTGEVVTGREAAARGELMVSGDVVNVAARLQQHAQVGQVLVGPRTHAATQRTIAYEPVTALDAKGKAEPVEAWAALHATAEPAERPSGFDSPLVGRDEELAVLTAVAARVERDSAPQLVTLLGQPGIGKSRLLAELVARLPQVRVLQGRCLPYEGVTYAPLVEALAGDGDALALLMGAGHSASDAREADPDEGRRRLEEAWRGHLETLGREMLTVLAIEDLHWAADALLDLLEALADTLVETRVILLCTSRPELLDRRPTWGAGKQNAAALTLGALGPAESERLVAALLGERTAPAALHERVLATTAGNPFFVAEMVRMLIDEGALRPDEGAWEVTERLTEVAPPDSIQSVIAARLDLLAPPGRDALRQCAVVGHVFWPQTVGVDEDVVAGLTRSGLVRERPRSALPGLREFEFNHALTRDVAYGTLTRPERRDLHRRVAEWTDGLATGDLETVELAAYHYGEALDYGADDLPLRRRAYDVALAAGTAAFNRGALASAQTFLERAASLAETPEQQLAAGIPLLHADLLEARLDEALARAIALEQVAGDDPNARAHVLSWRSRVSWLAGRWADAFEAANDAVDALSGLPESVELARALARRSQLAMLKAMPRAADDAREAIEVARRVGDPFSEVNARINLFTALAGMGVAPDPEEVLAIMATAIGAADHEDALRALVNLVWCAPGYIARPVVEETLARAEAVWPTGARPRALAMYFDVSLADLAITAGAWDEADARLAGLAHETLFGPARIVELIARAALALRRGGPPEAAPILAELRPLAFATEEPQRILPMASVLVPSLALEGRAAEVVSVADEVLAVLGDRVTVTFSLTGVLRGLALVGAFDQITRFAEGTRNAVVGEPAGRVGNSLACAAALLALHEGRPDDAVAAVAPPAKRERERGWLYDAACLETVLADALEAAGESDAARAQRVATAAFLDRIGCRYPY